jgi:hypothetical protein
MKGIYQIISLESGSREKFIQFLDIFYSDKDNDCEGVPCTAARGIALRLGIEARRTRGCPRSRERRRKKETEADAVERESAENVLDFLKG